MEMVKTQFCGHTQLGTLSAEKAKRMKEAPCGEEHFRQKGHFMQRSRSKRVDGTLEELKTQPS